MTLSTEEALHLGDLDAHDQAALVAGGEVSARELAEAAFTRITLVDPAVNAVTFAIDASAIKEPAGESALAGVPYLLKASLEYPGWPMTSCSRSRAQARGMTTYPFVRRLDAAGLVPVGMTAMPEFGLLTGGESMLTGAVRNPWAPDRSAGGSSTGAAAAVAAGLVPMAHASDAAGSIRVPAACSGVVGLKASRGANLRARAPHIIDDLLCCDGLVTRSVRDAAWAFETVLAGGVPMAPAQPLAGLRVASCLAGLDRQPPDPAVAAATERVADTLVTLGAHVEEIAVLPIDGDAILAAFQTIWVHEGGEIVDLIAAANPGIPLDRLLEPWTLALAERRRGLDLAATGAAFGQVAASAIAMAALFKRYDVVLSPVTSTPPPPLGELDPTREHDRLWDAFWRYTSYTPLANIAGIPSLSLPLGWTGDLPIGIMLTTGAGKDRTLLAMAAQLEEALPWRDRWPMNSATPVADRRSGRRRDEANEKAKART